MPKSTQREAIARQKAHGESLRSWLQDRATAAKKAVAKRRAEAAKNRPSRGVDRVPERYRGAGKPIVEHLVEHADENYRTRRDRGLSHGSGMRSGTNQPHVNPARDAKRGARLRKDVQA